jgi:hypothetical protein
MDLGTLIIGAIIGGIVTLPIAIFANIATPWVKSYFKKSSFSIRERRLYLLRERYQYIKKLKETATYFEIEIFQRIGWIILLIVELLPVIGAGILIPLNRLEGFPKFDSILMGKLFGLLLFSIVGFSFFFEMDNLLNALTEYDKYKEETKKKFIKLGGNTRELDKE